jgi:adenylate kinase
MAELIIFMGATGAGKSIQGAHMAKELGYAHLSSGELLREDSTEAETLASGDLVDSASVERIVSAAVGNVRKDQTIILDGFPRTLDEAIWLDEQLAVWQRKIRTIIVFDIDRLTSNQRLSARGRADDTPQALDQKWVKYQLLTQPVISYYETRGELEHVNGNGSVHEVFREIEAILK